MQEEDDSYFLLMSILHVFGHMYNIGEGVESSIQGYRKEYEALQSMKGINICMMPISIHTWPQSDIRLHNKVCVMSGLTDLNICALTYSSSGSCAENKVTIMSNFFKQFVIVF